MWCIIGLGNPGPDYDATRHNVGFDLIDLLSSRWRIPVKTKNPIFLFGSGNFKSTPVLLVKPMTFMNRSGDAYRRLLLDPEVTPAETIVVLDDLHLPLGRLRLRAKGGNGGHNGLDSIIRSAGTNAIPRIRIGIDGTEEAWEEFVLKPFRKEERVIIDEALVRAAEAVEMALIRDFETAMNRFN
ncbi:MAG: aminoacyl-tRNA hydrolase [bacterium]|nr:aminoacyl-tRNA hydrolase [bacterium]